MPVAVPKSRPRLSSTELRDRIAIYKLDRAQYPVVVVGIRGYYSEMGKPGEDDRGIYDDALFVDTSSLTSSYNGNTNPSRYMKGTAELVPGVWLSYKFANHVGPLASKSKNPDIAKGYPALCQRAGDVAVLRGGATVAVKGRYGINIHRGGLNSTGSIGCQTIHPAQWQSFISTAESEAARYFGTDWKRKAVVPYILIED